MARPSQRHRKKRKEFSRTTGIPRAQLISGFRMGRVKSVLGPLPKEDGIYRMCALCGAEYRRRLRQEIKGANYYARIKGTETMVFMCPEHWKRQGSPLGPNKGQHIRIDPKLATPGLFADPRPKKSE